MVKIKTPTAPVAVPEEPEAERGPSECFVGRTPSDWSIREVSDGVISCRNQVTGETYEGTTAEFNRRMRG